MTWIDRILTPLARLALRRGLRFADLSERLRRAVLRAAEAEAGPGATGSKLSVMTGLQRRDITRMQADPLPQGDTGEHPLARIIAAWQADPTLDRTLPMAGEAGSFQALARSVRQDVHPRTFMDALIEAGAVQEVDGQVTLLRAGYQPLAGSEDQLAYLGANVGDHLSAAVCNVLGDAEALEVSVSYQGLSAEAVADLDALWRSRIHSALQEVNSRAAAMPPSADGPCRFRAGAYFYSPTQSHAQIQGHRGPQE